jgi:hypothetical protein
VGAVFNRDAVWVGEEKEVAIGNRSHPLHGLLVGAVFNRDGLAIGKPSREVRAVPAVSPAQS